MSNNNNYKNKYQKHPTLIESEKFIPVDETYFQKHQTFIGNFIASVVKPNVTSFFSTKEVKE